MASSSTSTEQATERTDADLRRQAVSAATRTILDRYRDEFIAEAKKEAEALGVEYNPRKTAEERAREQIQRILAENPNLSLSDLTG